jgi:hypothetical protein
MGEGGCWQAGGLAGWPAVPSSQPFTQEGEWGVEVVGAQLGKTSTPDGGLQCTDGGCSVLLVTPVYVLPIHVLRST